jgi:hypothetical protein
MDIAGNTVYLTTLNPQGTRGTNNKLKSMEEPPSDTNNNNNNSYCYKKLFSIYKVLL